MDIEKKRRQKKGKFEHEEILNLFDKFLEEKGIKTKEFIIVAVWDNDGENFFDIFSTTNSAHEAVGILEMGKLYTFEGRE